MSNFIDETGNQYGTLSVLRKADNAYRKHGGAHWLCKCNSCGVEKVIRGDKLRLGTTVSCGRCARSLPFGEASFNRLYYSYKRGAAARGLTWALSEEQFRDLTKGLCNYCGKAPQQISDKMSPNGKYIYNGIDRIDNAVGYISTNVVSCCKRCNRAKAGMTREEFMSWGRRFYNHSLS